ncbi:MAG TPA: M50 family metallopeptidase [Fimbriimonadaceae bacterium]|nr:M50 family metallopeptidase [Fimbriimonadaceae bacterium]HRJ95316.1 M50 family metallopeptidase [Fimbriimonadaceae bacterium]
MTKFRRDQRLLLWASAISFALLLLPLGRFILLPLTYLNTHIHELCHALAALGTGGQPLEIKVLANGSGTTPVTGGFLSVIASAGYIGSAVIGAALIFFGRTEHGARTALTALGVGLAVSMLLYVRGDTIGVISGLAWIAVLFACARFLSALHVEFAAQFVGIQQCLNATLSLWILLRISTIPEIQSDASIMQQATSVPAIIWALLWTLTSGALLFLTLRRSWREAPSKRPRS